MTKPDMATEKIEKTLNRGLRSGVAILMLCVVGTAFASWVTYGADTDAPSPASAAITPAPTVPVYEVSTDMRDEYPAPELVKRTTKLKRRSTLIDALISLGADHGQANRALSVLYDNKFIDPRRVQAGLPITAYFNASDNELVAISLKPDTDRSIYARRLSDGEFLAANLTVKLKPAYKRLSAEINTSLYDAALEAGGADQQVVDFAQIFAFDIDFQREIHPGDQFEILYESLVDERGNVVRAGNVLFASLNGRALDRAYYRHTPEDDNISDYFTRDGKAATRFLMKTPINGARLSSSFGRRRHPISGYSRLHKGTDFAARSGTPIFAAGHGTVERASRYGGYGNYARIRHANGYKTAYAHMSRYGPGVKKGRRVRQGDIIGYVGSTGASTGPHLHYEVLINGKHVNAMRLKLPTGRTLEGEFLTAFERTRQELDMLRAAKAAETQIAGSASAADTHLR